MEFEAVSLNTKPYKVWVKVKWSISRKGFGFILHLWVVANKKGAFDSPLTTVANFTYIYIYITYLFLTDRLVRDFKIRYCSYVNKGLRKWITWIGNRKKNVLGFRNVFKDKNSQVVSQRSVSSKKNVMETIGL